MIIDITGEYGFIGSHLVPKLIEQGHEIREKGTPIVEKAVIHLAATTTLSKDFISELFDNNVVFAHKIMQRTCKIVYASSTSAAELTNPYAYTKRYLEYLGEKHGNAVGLRFFNTYGPNNNKGIVKAAFEAAINGTPLTISGGDQIRDFIHVDDITRTIINALDWEPGIYDVGTGKGTTIRHLIRMIEEITGHRINVTYTEASDTDMAISVANPPITNCIPLYEGLKSMLNNY